MQNAALKITESNDEQSKLRIVVAWKEKNNKEVLCKKKPTVFVIDD